MSLSLPLAILETIIYADVFDYPLTWEEIGKWLIKIKNQKYNSKIKNTIQKSKIIEELDGYYFIKDRKNIVAERIKKEKYSQEKSTIAQDIADLCKLIPAVKLVGITGALAVSNAKKEDDIDLFIITSRGLLWTTRLLATLLIEITGARRHPGESRVNNKICLNMFADEDHLEIPQKDQDLFSAHEVLQMTPLFVRDNIYQKFLRENNWVEKYLPNAYKEITLARSGKDTSDGGETTISTPPRWRNIHPFENILKSFQLWYMRKRRTTEIIQEGILRFHPHDAREWVMSRYKERLSEFML